MKPVNFKTQTLLTAVAALLAASFAVPGGASLASAADGSSSGTRGDGFTLLGQYSASGVEIKIPDFSGAQIAEQVAKLKATLKDPQLKYEDLFDPRDQAAFDELQAQITARVSQVTEALYRTKRSFIEGTVVYGHFAKDTTDDKKARDRELGSVAQTYREYMKGQYDWVIGILNPTVPLQGPYMYEMDDKHNVKGLALATYSEGAVSYGDGGRTRADSSEKVTEVILGDVDMSACHFSEDPTQARAQSKPSGCDWYATKGSIVDVANNCQTSVCVQEVGRVAQELLALSQSLYVKISFKNSDAEQLSLFYNPQHSLLRQALSNYMDREFTNKDSSVVAAAILGITNIGYRTLITPVDFLVNLRMVDTSLDFMPTYWRDGGQRRHAANSLSESFTNVASQKLTASMSGLKNP